jgi:hypothetical protein
MFHLLQRYIMANEMSRRGWFGIVGGLLAAFGLVPQAKAQAPKIKPPTPSVEYASYPGGTGYSTTSATTYIYDAYKPWTSVGQPIPGTGIRYTYQPPKQ